MRPVLKNLIIHGEHGEKIPISWGIDKILEHYPIPIKRSYITWDIENKIVKFELDGVVSWDVLPDRTGIIAVLSSNDHDNAIVFDAFGNERMVVKNSFDPSEYKVNIINYYFSRVWCEKKAIWLAVACKVRMAVTGIAYYEYKALFNIQRNKLSEFVPIQR